VHNLKGFPETISWAEFEASCNSLIRNGSTQIPIDAPICIFGAGRFGRDLARAFKIKGYKVLGFIETSPQSSVCDELSIYSWSELPTDAAKSQIAIGIHNRDMALEDLINLVKDAGYSKILMPWDCYEILGEELGWRYWLSKKSTILENLPRLKGVYDNLSDDASRSCLLQLSLFRLGLNNSYSHFHHQDVQYFNDLTLSLFKEIKSLSYVDCGAYNGDTFLQLSKVISVGDSYLFEPDPSNYRELVREVRASNLDPTLLPLAVSDKYKILSFSSGGEGGTISEGGSVQIAAVSLDEVLVNKKIHFMKFDVEGGEIEAIAGSRNLIRENRPVLAISLYHRPVDLWEIPELLQKICVDYSFYIRQHFFNSFDSVIYAIPR
jgi:FkbM family methyltransferase